MGDEAANRLFLTHERLTRTELERMGAVETRYTGDGFMVLFPTARQAINAAVAIQRAIDEQNRENPDLPIKVRMGLNSGDVMRQSGQVYGIAVHAAARIADKAQGGQILVSQLVHELAGTLPDLRLTDRGLYWLKGLPTRWRLFEVLWRERPERPKAPAAGGVAQPSRHDLALPRARGPVVGRPEILGALTEEINRAASGGLRAVVLEGEAGIGKTRMLEAAAEMSSGSDPSCWALSVAADEELRGPFLLFRTLLSDPRVSDMAEEARSLEPLGRAREALSGNGSFRQQGLAPQEEMLRLYDEVAQALSALARERPLALLLDDLQWADEDSIRITRYLVRTLASLPIFMLLTTRPVSDSTGAGAANLITDMERMHLARRLWLERFTRSETAALLESLLGAPLSPATLDSLHTRAEGVPFFIEEFARAFREAKVLQLIDGVWTMTRLSGPTVPASVQSLIARRLAQVSDETRLLLADAAVMGRRFRLGDLSEVLAHVDGATEVEEWQLEDRLQPAVEGGIVTGLAEGTGYDYSFTHDQIRAALVESSSRQRRRAIHGAVASGVGVGEGRENLSSLAYHAFHAGNEQLAVSYAIQAGRAGLEAHAPEEAIRVIEATLGAASTPQDRIAMLSVKDDALALLDRGADRMANLAEMGALAGALGDPRLEREVKLRRASAARMTGDFDIAADLARQVREAAAVMGDPVSELAACLELGQSITRSPLGEGFWPLVEVDLDAAAEPFTRGLEIARELGDREKEAAALRELAVLEAGRAKLSLMEEAGRGKGFYEVIGLAPDRLTAAKELANRAFQIYEELGDRRGAMSALISTAYVHVADPTPRGMAGRLEQVRRLYHNRRGDTTESQRAVDDAMMLYSIHVFARANAYPDLALERGRQAFEAARAVGNRWLEALAAGGVGMALVSLGDHGEAEAWVDMAASAALADPRPAMARRLEMWRGILAGAQGDGEGLVRHLETAARLAGEQHSPGGRCEALARLAMEAARLALQEDDPALMERAEQAATQTLDLVKTLPGQLPWEALGHAVSALSADARGRGEDALEEARLALAILQPRLNRAHNFDVVWAVGRVLIRGKAPEAHDLAQEINEDLAHVEQAIADDDVRRRWFGVPMHRELAEMAGYEPAFEATATPSTGLEEPEVEMLQLLISGSDDEEIASRLNADQAEVDERIAGLLERIGVSSRVAASEYAIRAGIS